MPVITVEGPQIDRERKRELVEGITETASQIYRMPKGSIVVLIKENQAENVAVGGSLICDSSD
ncbi:MAG: 4-oxalocrotonate tautomerase DmpI [Methanomassiliicoccales archaeon]